MRYLRLLATFARAELQTDLAYRVNLVLQVVQMLVVIATSVAAVLVLFSYTTQLNGWTLEQMIVLLGVFYVVQGVEETILTPSFNRFMEHVRLGTLDFVLLKPVSTRFMVSMRHMELVQVGQTLVGLGVLTYGVAQLGETLTVSAVLAFVVTLSCGMVLIYSLLLTLVTFSFWLTRIENLMAIFWSFIDAGRFPIDVYPGWLRVTMSTVVPVGIAVTVPAQALAGRLDAAGLVAVMVGTVAAWLFSLWFFQFGLRSYTGASA